MGSILSMWGQGYVGWAIIIVCGQYLHVGYVGCAIIRVCRVGSI